MPNTAVSYAKRKQLCYSPDISAHQRSIIHAQVSVCIKFQWTNTRVACFFPHSPTHRWSRRSRRKCNPPTKRFSWCLVELELKYTSKTPDTVGYQKDAIDWFPRTAGSKNEFILRGGPHRKTKQNKTKRKQKHPSDKNCWRLKEKYESCSSRDMNTFLNYNLSCGDLFVTHHLYVKLDFILGQTNLLLQLATKFQW